MSKLNIVYISNFYPPFVEGGAELVAAHLAEEMARRGHDATVISTAPPTEGDARGVSREVQNGISVRRFFPKNLYWEGDRSTRARWKRVIWHVRDAWNLQAGRVLRQQFLDLKPSVVHTHNISGFSPIAWREARKLGIPVVHTAHDFHLLCPRSTLLRSSGAVCERAPLPCQVYRRIHRLASTQIDVFCAPSQFVLDLHREMQVRAHRWEVVPNGIPQPHSHATPPRQLAGGTLRLLYMGQLAAHKGVETLLRAFALLPLDRRVSLDIAGRGPLEPRILEAQARDARIRFHGFVDGPVKEELLASSDVLVLPSEWYENAPISVIEAYAHGLIAVASDIGGLPEMVNDGETGLVFQSGNAEALRHALELLATDTPLLSRLQGGAKAAGNNYSVGEMANAYADIYAELTKPAQDGPKRRCGDAI